MFILAAPTNYVLKPSTFCENDHFIQEVDKSGDFCDSIITMSSTELKLLLNIQDCHVYIDPTIKL